MKLPLDYFRLPYHREFWLGRSIKVFEWTISYHFVFFPSSCHGLKNDKNKKHLEATLTLTVCCTSKIDMLRVVHCLISGGKTFQTRLKSYNWLQHHYPSPWLHRNIHILLSSFPPSTGLFRWVDYSLMVNVIGIHGAGVEGSSPRVWNAFDSERGSGWDRT